MTRLVRTVEWLPALTAAAYLALVFVKLPSLVGSLYWDSDAAAALVLGERLRGHGEVLIPHFGWWSSLWWLLATRDLPGHERLWEVTGLAFALAAVACVGWATARVAGRWAGVTAAAVTVVVGPVALRSLLSVNFHSSTPFTAVVLGAYVAVLERYRSWILAVAVGLLAGVNAASDPLLVIAGVVPFAIAAGVLASLRKNRAIAARAALVLAVAAISGVATAVVMHRLGFTILSAAIGPAAAGDLASNFVKLGKSVALVFGANHFFPGVYPREPFKAGITLLAYAALAATLVTAARLLLRRSRPTATAYACYWAASVLLVGLGSWATSEGTAVGAGGGVNYVLSLAAAAGVGVAMLAAGSRRGRLAVALAVTAVGIVNIAEIANGRVETYSGTASRYGPEVIRLLERKGVTRGYAGYWDAHSLSWKSGMRLLIAPVSQCRLPDRSLCREQLFTIDSWWKEHPGPSFLVVDRGFSSFVSRPPPASTHPVASYAVGPVTVYLFDYDLARAIR